MCVYIYIFDNFISNFTTYGHPHLKVYVHCVCRVALLTSLLAVYNMVITNTECHGG